MLIDSDGDSLDFTGWPRPALRTGDDSVRFAEGVTLADLSVSPSKDGHLMIYCRDSIVAVLSAMGGGPERFHFADGVLLSAEELLALL